MKRLLALCVVGFLLTGCQGQSPPASDPFVLGRTRVPPPRTGAISRRSYDPYRQGASDSMSPRVAPRPLSSTVSIPSPASGDGRNLTSTAVDLSRPVSSVRGPGTSGRFGPGTRIPPPSFTPRVTRGVPLVAIKPTVQGVSEPGDDRPDKASDMGLPVKREPVVRILQPRQPIASNSALHNVPHSTVGRTPAEPRRLSVAADAVDIMELPESHASASSPQARSSSVDNGFRLVSATDESGNSADVTAAAPHGNYGHGPEYVWLRGKLEYSQIDRHWKVRYIPIDGKTDKFGGSVVLPDATQLTSLERGDFVEIRGQMTFGDGRKGYAPTYEVAQIKRLSRARP